MTSLAVGMRKDPTWRARKWDATSHVRTNLQDALSLIDRKANVEDINKSLLEVSLHPPATLRPETYTPSVTCHPLYQRLKPGI